MDDLYKIIISCIVCVIILALTTGLAILIKKLGEKKQLNKINELFNKINELSENELIIKVKEYISGIDIDSFNDNFNNPSELFKIIESEILAYTMEQANKSIMILIKDDCEKCAPSVYSEVLSKLSNPINIEDVVGTVLANEDIKNMITNIYNKCFDGEIIRIEDDDKKLEKELSQYEEKAEILDETQEQHNQTIEEYAQKHIQEKVDELNKVYDEVEETIPNTVPVRDLRELKLLFYDEELNPPVDNPDDSVFEDDGTSEIIEYIEEESTEN